MKNQIPLYICKLLVFLFAITISNYPFEAFTQTNNDTTISKPKQYGEISGKVSDEKGKPIDYATIQVCDNNNYNKTVGAAYSNEDGSFNIKNIPKGIYNIKISYKA